MRIEIYRKRQVFNSYVVDDTPEIIYNNVQAIELHKHILLGNVDGEQLTVLLDWGNYDYHIL